MCVPVRADLIEQVDGLARRQAGAMHRLVDRRRADFRAAARALPSGEDLLSTNRQRLDQAGERLASRVAAGLRDRQIRLAAAAQKLARHSPQAAFARNEERLKSLAARLSAALQARARLATRDVSAKGEKLLGLGQRLSVARAAYIARRVEKLGALGKLMETLSYRNVLARGFALVRDGESNPLRLAAQVASGARLSIEFADGAIAATADGGASPAPKPRAKRQSEDKKQGSLF
jgi:exodeoxyribonuclease VII large subunit